MRLIRTIAVFLTILALVGGFVYWSNCVIETEEFEICIETLPEAFAGLRICVLSDLHGRQFGKNNHELLLEVKQANADLICICGDLIDEDEQLKMLPELIGGLCAIAPTYYVSGNHEWQLSEPRQVLERIEALGATVLRNEFAVLEREGQKIVIAGVDDPCGPYDQKTPQTLMEEIGSTCVIMLDHRNHRLEMWQELGADLVLSGHCHGGVVRLPFVGGVFGTDRELFPEFDGGVYEKNGTKLFVSRGLGYTNVRLRLFNRPQVAVLTLVNNS